MTGGAGQGWSTGRYPSALAVAWGAVIAGFDVSRTSRPRPPLRRPGRPA